MRNDAQVTSASTPLSLHASNSYDQLKTRPAPRVDLIDIVTHAQRPFEYQSCVTPVIGVSSPTVQTLLAGYDGYRRITREAPWSQARRQGSLGFWFRRRDISLTNTLVVQRRCALSTILVCDDRHICSIDGAME